MELPDEVVQKYLESRKTETQEEKEAGIKMVQAARERILRSSTEATKKP